MIKKLIGFGFSLIGVVVLGFLSLFIVAAFTGPSGAPANESGAIAVDAEGDVGIGIDNAVAPLQVYSTSQASSVFSGGGGVALNTGVLFSVDGTTTDQSTYGRIAIAPTASYGTTELYFPNRPQGNSYAEFGSGVRHIWGGSDARRGELAFFTSTVGQQNVERVRIDSNGNVGIGTSSPGSYKLNVNGNVNISGSCTGCGGGGFSGSYTSPSRTYDTTYTNGSNARFVLIMLNQNGSASFKMDAVIDGVVRATAVGSNQGDSAWETLSFIVPPNSTYRLNWENGNLPLITWSELE